MPPKRSPKTDPAAVKYATTEVNERGRSLREVQRELASMGVNVSHETIRGWCRAVPAEPTPSFNALEEARSLVWCLEGAGGVDVSPADLGEVWQALSKAMAVLVQDTASA